MIKNYLDYLTLCSKMADWHRNYHEEGIEPISNADYDKYRKEIIKWEKEHPTQLSNISPVYKVGSIANENKKDELRHEYRMASIENALNPEEAQSFINLWTKLYGPDLDIIGEFKYDGMAISVRYMDGVFTRALTRGDGEFGEDVTQHVALFISDRIEAMGSVEIRGEAIIKAKWLDYINIGREPYANGRSAVAGLLNSARKEPSKHASGLTFAPYDLEGADFVFGKYTDKLETLKHLNFHMLSCFILKPDAVHALFQQVQELRDKGDIPYDIDGMVFKINDVDKQLQLGETSHHPRHMFAYKFPPTTGVCKLLDVVFQVGRSGEIAPVAKITATPLMGVIVTSVLLHNEERMKDRKVAIGHTYEVYRSGDVIPHLGKLLEEDVEAVPVEFPGRCPSCNDKVVKRGATYYCINTARCPAQTLAGIAYAVSRDVLNVDGLAEQTIDLMIKSGLVNCTLAPPRRPAARPPPRTCFYISGSHALPDPFPPIGRYLHLPRTLLGGP